MARVLIATIGKRDPFEGGEPTGPVRAAREWHPEAALLIAAEGVTAQADATRDALAAEFPGIAVTVDILERLQPGKPDLIVDIDALLRAGSALFYRHRELLDPRANDIAACFTSGTPQASIAMTLVTRSLLPGARHFQALAPKDSSDRERLLREFDPDALVRMEARDRIYAALARGDSGDALAASVPLLGLRQPPWNAEALRIALAIAHALRAAESFRRHELSRPLGATSQGRKLGDAIQATVGAYSRWFATCETDDLAWGSELSASALRIGGAAGPTLGVIAAAVASEVLISARLRKLGYDPEKLSVGQAERLPEELSRGLVAFAPGLLRLEGARNRSDLLAELDPQYRAKQSGVEDSRQRVAEVRNNAVHKGKPATGEQFSQAIAMLDRLAAAVGAPAPSNLPTTPTRLAELAEQLKGLR